MAITSTNHLGPAAVADRLLQQARQATGIARPATDETPVGITRQENPARPGIQNGPTPNSSASEVPGINHEPRGLTPEQRQKLVLRPSEVSLEDRLELVMSLEDVQRLLLVRNPMPEAPGLNRSPTGQLLDFHS